MYAANTHKLPLMYLTPFAAKPIGKMNMRIDALLKHAYTMHLHIRFLRNDIHMIYDTNKKGAVVCLQPLNT
jgi:hypothetical protein